MAELQNSRFYGMNGNIIGNRELLVQLHITAKCDQNCAHCYLHEENNYEKLIKNELSKETLFSLIEELSCYANQRGGKLSLYITGGDPILSEKFGRSWNF